MPVENATINNVLKHASRNLMYKVNSTDGNNTLSEHFRLGFILQGLAWPFIQLTGNCAKFCLGMDRQVGASWQILPEKPIGVLV